MKSIQLTEKHKSKLLEMCEKLFPNNKIDSFQFGNIKFLINHYIKKDSKNSKITFEGWDEILVIHWFEFCMTHLAEKLNDLSDVYEEMPPYVANVYGGANGKWNLYVKFHFHYPKNRYKKHPVDYLYEEFKKLK